MKPKIHYPNKITVAHRDMLLGSKNKTGFFGLAFKDEAIIHIDPNQPPKDYMDSLIHEALHVLFKEWKEEDVYNLSVFLSTFLWDNGYRKIHKEDDSTIFGISPKMETPTIKNIRQMKVAPPLKTTGYSRIQPEYERMFSECQIRVQNETSTAVDRIIKNREIYEKIEIAPWYWIGCIHFREASLNFRTHLHNGDPLRRRTVNIPSGRPKSEPTTVGGYAWDVSAKDALQLKGLHKWSDWSIPGMLYQAERYNGWGYRLYKNNNSPYLWSGSQFWTMGKYVKDGKYDPNFARDQVGVAVLLKEMKNRKIF
jgi:lysozyme family protein